MDNRTQGNATFFLCILYMERWGVGYYQHNLSGSLHRLYQRTYNNLV